MKKFLKEEWKTIFIMTAIFIACYYLPVGTARFDNAVLESLHLVRWYVREHVIMCLIPAFFISGAITVFISQNTVIKYLGAKANKLLAYSVASVAGSILAVCSCTILPLFNGIYKLGAGLGPACTFLYSGPAINILAIVLSARILGLDIGIARSVGAILLSIVIGILMEQFFFEQKTDNAESLKHSFSDENCNNNQLQHQQQIELEHAKPLWYNFLLLASLIGILVFANWSKPQTSVFYLKDGTKIIGIINNENEINNLSSSDVISIRVLDQASTSQIKHLINKQNLIYQKNYNTKNNENNEEIVITISKNEIKAIDVYLNIWGYIWLYKWKITTVFGILLMLSMLVGLNIKYTKVIAMLTLAIIGYIINPIDHTITFVLASLGLCYATLSSENEAREWFLASWENAKMILPMLLVGVLIAGFLFGSVGKEGIIPQNYIKPLVGGNSVLANFIASIVGAFMYFATLTEVPIVQGLLNSGMGKGPAIALLLAGPALSLPSMLVINNIMGLKKTIAFISLTVVLATLYGNLVGLAM